MKPLIAHGKMLLALVILMVVLPMVGNSSIFAATRTMQGQANTQDTATSTPATSVLSLDQHTIGPGTACTTSDNQTWTCNMTLSAANVPNGVTITLFVSLSSRASASYVNLGINSLSSSVTPHLQLSLPLLYWHHTVDYPL